MNSSIIRKSVFTRLQASDPAKPDVLVLPELCYHKWNFREHAISVVRRRYGHLLEMLDYFAENGKPEATADAHLRKPSNVCMLVTVYDIFT